MSTAHPIRARNVRSGVLIVSDAAMLTLSDAQHGLTERERRALRSGWVRASRRERDRAVLAAEAAGYTAAAVGRSFGLSRTSVTRIVRTGDDTGRPG